MNTSILNLKTEDYKYQFVGTLEKTPENITKIESTIKLIAGRLNNCNSTYYWQIEEGLDCEIGDYAIVENMNDYDLVKIVGIVETTEKYVKFITNSKINKKVINIIERQDIRED